MYSLLGVTPIPLDASGLDVMDTTDSAETAKIELKTLGRPLGWNRLGPSVKKMAEESGHLDEYDFLYLASSQSVHSNLYAMARQVWGDSGSMRMTIGHKLGDEADAVFATVYGTWILDQVLRELAIHAPPLEALMSSDEWSVWLALILVGTARNGRLPPIVHEAELQWRPGGE